MMDARRALSAAEVGARAPSWNYEPEAVAPFCESVTTMLGPSANALRVQMGRDERRSVSLYGPAARSSVQNVVRRDLERLLTPLSQRGNRRAPALALFLQQRRMALHVKPVKVTEFSSSSEPLTRRPYSPYRESSLDGARGLFIQHPCTITPTSRLYPGKIENQQCSAPVYTCIKSNYFRSGFRKGYAIFYEKNEPFHHF
jgi:hypothetical protein